MNIPNIDPIRPNLRGYEAKNDIKGNQQASQSQSNSKIASTVDLRLAQELRSPSPESRESLLNEVKSRIQSGEYSTREAAESAAKQFLREI
ncbi:MAG: hypothetical protein AAGA30_20870 [Planctomycetota bacterium]